MALYGEVLCNWGAGEDADGDLIYYDDGGEEIGRDPLCWNHAREPLHLPENWDSAATEFEWYWDDE